jgi:hypothetical protein
VPRSWLSSTKRTLKRGIEREVTLDRQYSELAARSLGAAAQYEVRGDVRALDRLVADVREEDGRLGYQRPNDVTTLLASLAARTESARAVRLAADRWEYRKKTFAAYRDQIYGSFDKFGGVVADIGAVRDLSGPNLRQLPKTDKRISAIEVGLLPLDPPAGLRPAHDMLLSSVRLMREAVRLRRVAAASGEMSVAENASAAAAGSLLLLDLARAHIDDFFRRPALP